MSHAMESVVPIFFVVTQGKQEWYFENEMAAKKQLLARTLNICNIDVEDFENSLFNFFTFNNEEREAYKQSTTQSNLTIAYEMKLNMELISKLQMHTLTQLIETVAVSKSPENN